MELVKRFFLDETGQGMAEYGLILALVAIAVVAVLGLLGDQLVAIFTKVKDSLVTE